MQIDKYIKTEAVVLATNDFGDFNRVVTLFTKDYGKTEANAYGCRRIKSPLSGAMQMFNHIEVQYVNGNPNRIHDADIISFHNVSEDLNKLMYGSIMFETIKKMTPFEVSEVDVFKLLINYLNAIDKRNPRIATLIGLIQFVNRSGFDIKSNDTISMLNNFDWHDESKLTIKNSKLDSIEQYIFNHIQLIIGSPLNSLQFKNMYEQCKLQSPKHQQHHQV